MLFRKRASVFFAFFDKKEGRTFRTCPSFLFHIEALLEAINTSASVNQLLLAGIERMAFGTNINLHLFLGRTGFKCFTAHAANDAFAVLGMNVFLHCFFTSFAYAMALNAKMIISYSAAFCNIFLLRFRNLLKWNSYRFFLLTHGLLF